MTRSRDLSRLLRPKSIAVIGGGVWCKQVVQQSLRMGFAGQIARVHPSPDPVEGIAAVPSIDALPFVPDAVFLGVNRETTVDAVAALSAMGAGGAVCFASGFGEAAQEDASGARLQQALVDAAGDMPILGPNCYGFINAVDGALLWPDQHGCTRVDKGVAILTQSSNIAINLTMQQRALPISYVVTCGNMAICAQAEIATALLDDAHVTAIGLHVEGFGDTKLWHKFALQAEARGIPVIVLKVGASEQAQRATLSHTASLAGSDAGADALLQRLGMPRLHDLDSFLEALMLLHCSGYLGGTALSSISCSGGEASLVADMATPFDVSFPALTDPQRKALCKVLGARVALSNPLDYHTYIWGDREKMIAAWLPMAAAHIDIVLIVLDYPHTDATAWAPATEAAIAVRQRSGKPVAVVSSLSELLPQEISRALIANGVTPLHGLHEALVAVQAAGTRRPPNTTPALTAGPEGKAHLLREAEAKAILARYGLHIPASIAATRSALAKAAADLTPPLALKASGLAHKSDVGGVRLNLHPQDLEQVAAAMPGDHFLIEEMVQGTVCELLIGVTCDPAHGFVLTVSAGGVLTELWQDSQSALLPVDQSELAQMLRRLRIFPLISGYRNARAANEEAILDAILAVQAYVTDHADRLREAEINPLICTPETAIAADALVACLPNSPDAGEPDAPD